MQVRGEPDTSLLAGAGVGAAGNSQGLPGDLRASEGGQRCRRKADRGSRRRWRFRAAPCRGLGLPLLRAVSPSPPLPRDSMLNSKTSELGRCAAIGGKHSRAQKAESLTTVYSCP